jgi:hypothetical protein
MKILLRTIQYYCLSKCAWILPQYKIRGARTYYHHHLIELKFPNKIKGKLDIYYKKLLAILKTKLDKKQSFSIIRVCDGEAYFLQGRDIGNIKKRHLLNMNIEAIDLNEWVIKLKANDLITFDISYKLRKLTLRLFPENIKSDRYFPFDVIYAAVATRELFTIIKNYKVGIIGAETKLSVIKKLIKFPEYQQYLGISQFHHYLGIPEKGSCDNVDDIHNTIADQIKRHNPKCDIYLIGMGISKLYIQSELAKSFKKVFLDIGCGIDAIAGIIPNDRPFFGNWINYRIWSYNYTNIDLLTKKNKYIKDLCIYL